MAKTKTPSGKLYSRMRAAGVRKRVAKELTDLPVLSKNGKRAPKAVRQAVDRLDQAVAELRDHVGRGDRSASGRKAARTRKSNSDQRKRAARRGARKRS